MRLSQCGYQHCIGRCVTKYGGSAYSEGNSYYCAKGCAGMAGYQIVNANLLCDVPENDRYSWCLSRCDGGDISTNSNQRGYCKFGCEFWNQAGFSFFNQIQFPLAYNFPQDDDTGVVDRSFTQDAFMGGSSATLTNRKFSLVDPETNMALSVTDCALPLVRKVKLQHDSTDTNILNIGEVEVYDQSNTNQALGKAASQSSNYGDYRSGNFPASNAVDGNPNTFSHTWVDHGKLSFYEYYNIISS